jgi:hypothetical protein
MGGLEVSVVQHRGAWVARSAVLSIVALVAGSGCDWLLGEEVDGLRQVAATDASDSSGAVSFNVRVTEGETAMLLTATTSADKLAVFYEMYAPDGSKVLDAESLWTQIRSETGAVFPASTVSLNWPVTQGTSLDPGVYEVVLRTTDKQYYYSPGVELTLDQLFKIDDAFSGGKLDVNIVYAGGTDQDPELVAATEAALEYWTEMYAAIGIEPVFSTSTHQEGKLPPPGEGAAAEYEAIADSTPLRSVNVVIVPFIDGYQGQGLYGIAGGIPGPLVSTPSSAVTVDALTNSGPDLMFSEDEIQIYGETLAHEVGHFIGLFHPVEADYSFFDAVNDTPECASRNDCEDNLGNNLMFPYPVCSFSGCVKQNELSDGQGNISQRYTGVD